jgi:hypothetical protein
LFGLALVAGAGAARADLRPQDVPLPPGTLPMYVEDPVLPDDGETPVGFGCFGACGASCECVGRQDGEATTTLDDGRVCTWQTTSCSTHEFCRWHDGCYRACDYQYPGTVNDTSWSRTWCYRTCDASCVTGRDPGPAAGWSPPSLDPGPPPDGGLGLAMCARRLAWDPTVPYDGKLTYARLLACTPARAGR